MATKKDKNSEQKDKGSILGEIKTETAQAIVAIVAFLIALLSLMAAFGKAGMVGEYSFMLLGNFFGIGYYLIPAILIMISFAAVRGIEKRLELSKIISAFILFIAGLGLIEIMSIGKGGVAGHWIAYPLIKLIDTPASAVLLLAVCVITLFIILEAHFTIEHLAFWRWFRTKTEKDASKTGENKVDGMDAYEQAKVEQAVAAVQTDMSKRADMPVSKKAQAESKNGRGAGNGGSDEEGMFTPAVQVPLLSPFTPPPLSLLEKDRGKPETGDIKANANIIKRTLQNFGISVEMDEISIGPSVTRYALKPAEGIKLARIVALNNDLALALAAHPIRIEAPIPGKSLVGIEVPNTAKTTVGLATLLSSPDFSESEKPLLMSLGKDIAGKAHFCNLGKAPHTLIAGATGSGKSVTIHALITSLLYRNSPENLKFIMIDPKRVELTLYNKIPHLLTPVITDAKKAILALKWAAKEMSRRYDVLEKNAARDIDSYHKNILAPAIEEAKKSKPEKIDASKLPETMPFLVIIIDELADIMQSYPRELESAIVRLAQMSRAVGIHLILSTQRPSVNVITGLIKANVPTRVALQVASQVDSRTILDQVGAEKLLGAGDMLYLGGEMSKPIRLQSAFISETEVKKVVKYLADTYKDEIMSTVNLAEREAGSDAAFKAMNGASGASSGVGPKGIDAASNSGAGLDLDAEESLEDEDELFGAAREAVISAGKASTSYIQRKLGVGYSRAAKLMDMLEARGVIGPANGSKPREVIGGSDTSSGASGSDTLENVANDLGNPESSM